MPRLARQARADRAWSRRWRGSRRWHGCRRCPWHRAAGTQRHCHHQRQAESVHGRSLQVALHCDVLFAPAPWTAA